MTVTHMPNSDAQLGSLSGSPRRLRREAIIKQALFGAAIFSVVISFLIVYALLSEAWVFIRDIDWSVTWGEIGWFPRRGVYDIPTLLVATFWVTAIAMMVAAPLGLGAAVYLAEYARPRVRKFLKPALEILAGPAFALVEDPIHRLVAFELCRDDATPGAWVTGRPLHDE